MKNLKTLALCAIVATTGLVAATDAYANCGMNQRGQHVCIERLGNNKFHVIVDDRFNGTGYVMHADCTTGNWRAHSVSGVSKAQLNREARIVCSFDY